MKLGDLDLNDIIDALGMVRSDWITIQKEQHRRLTDADRVTVCVLAALEQALRRLASTRQDRGVTEQAEQRIEIIGSHPFDKTVLDGLAKALDDTGPVDAGEGEALVKLAKLIEEIVKGIIGDLDVDTFAKALPQEAVGLVGCSELERRRLTEAERARDIWRGVSFRYFFDGTVGPMTTIYVVAIITLLGLGWISSTPLTVFLCAAFAGEGIREGRLHPPLGMESGSTRSPCLISLAGPRVSFNHSTSGSSSGKGWAQQACRCMRSLLARLGPHEPGSVSYVKGRVSGEN